MIDVALMRTISIIIFLLISANACKKDSVKDNCDNLKLAILSNNSAMTKSALYEIIATLPSQDYSRLNVQNLVNRITIDCGLPTELLCYNCIFTLPPQTEIRILVNSPASTQQKVIDLSYTTENKITIIRVHE
jgi:hypothetical protein